MKKLTQKEKDMEALSSFWSCECKKDYIHSIEEKECNECGMVEDNEADRRWAEERDMYKKFDADGVLHEVVQLHIGDSLRILPETKEFILQCCGCNKIHNYKVTHENGAVKLTVG